MKGLLDTLKAAKSHINIQKNKTMTKQQHLNRAIAMSYLLDAVMGIVVEQGYEAIERYHPEAMAGFIAVLAEIKRESELGGNPQIYRTVVYDALQMDVIETKDEKWDAPFSKNPDLTL